jgi:hypothetical protein
MSAEPTHAERNRSATDSPDALGRHKAVARPAPITPEHPITCGHKCGDALRENRPDRRFACMLRSRSVTALRPLSSGCRRPVRPAVGPPDGAASRCGLPGGAGDVRGDDVGSVPVQASAGPVVPHRGSRAGPVSGPYRPACTSSPSGSGKAGSSRQPTADSRSPGSSERRHPLCWGGTATMAALRTHVSYRLTPHELYTVRQTAGHLADANISLLLCAVLPAEDPG